MSSERERPPEKPKTETAPDISQRPRPGNTRCPFCHESCEADADACACAECLSRHHVACWEESRGCATCRSPRRLEVRAHDADDKGYAGAIGAWLKLGLVYNAGLALLTVAVLGARVAAPLILAQVAVGAAIANLCFLAGPTIELLARRFGYRGSALRWILFTIGFGIALVLALASCLSV